MKYNNKITTFKVSGYMVLTNYTLSCMFPFDLAQNGSLRHISFSYQQLLIQRPPLNLHWCTFNCLATAAAAFSQRSACLAGLRLGSCLCADQPSTSVTASVLGALARMRHARNTGVNNGDSWPYTINGLAGNENNKRSI